MTNPVHLLITPEQGEAVPRLIIALDRRYVQYINKTWRRTGSRWATAGYSPRSKPRPASGAKSDPVGGKKKKKRNSKPQQDLNRDRLKYEKSTIRCFLSWTDRIQTGI